MITKKERKKLLKQLTKEQRKIFQAYFFHIADNMLEIYSETIRLKSMPGISTIYTSIPIFETKMDLEIRLKLKERELIL